MGYARQVYTQAENELNRRRTTAQDNAQRRLENFYAVCPEAEDVRRRIASTASRAAMAVLRSGNARETMEALKNENLSLQKQFADRSGSVENDSLGYKWISIDSFCEKNASPLVIKVCELINNKKSFEIIEYVI